MMMEFGRKKPRIQIPAGAKKHNAGKNLGVHIGMNFYYLNLESTSRHPIPKFSIIDLRSEIFIFSNQFFLGIINVFVFVRRWEGDNGKYRPLFSKVEKLFKIWSP